MRARIIPLLPTMEESIHSFIIKYYVNCRVFVICYLSSSGSSIPNLLGYFVINKCWIVSNNFFLYPLRFFFLFENDNIVNCIDLFLMLKQIFIHGQILLVKHFPFALSYQIYWPKIVSRIPLLSLSCIDIKY